MKPEQDNVCDLRFTVLFLWEQPSGLTRSVHITPSKRCARWE